MLKYIKKLNPEINTNTRAVLYTIGSWGVIHLSIMGVISVYKSDVRELNTLIAINFDTFFPSVKQSYLLFVMSWIGLIFSVCVMRSLIKKNKN